MEPWQYQQEKDGYPDTDPVCENCEGMGCIECTAPDPNCYACLGTGYIQWAGMKPVECPCLHREDE